MKVSRNTAEGTISLSQVLYLTDKFKEFHMMNCKPRDTPMDRLVEKQAREDIEEDYPYRELVGSLIYAATCTRPDISYSVRYLGQFMTKIHRRTLQVGS